MATPALLNNSVCLAVQKAGKQVAYYLDMRLAPSPVKHYRDMGATSDAAWKLSTKGPGSTEPGALEIEHF
jgi:hypothetical protein